MSGPSGLTSVMLIGGPAAGARRKLEGARIEVLTDYADVGDGKHATATRASYRFEKFELGDGGPPIVLAVEERMTARQAFEALLMAYEQKHGYDAARRTPRPPR